MLNIFSNLKENAIATQQRGELYMRLFGHLSEDFANHKDLLTFCQNLLTYITELERKLDALGSQLESHTHEITPHTHPIPDHVHMIQPHIHIAPTYGGPTSPTPLTTMPNGSKTTQTNAGLQTQMAINSGSLRWMQGTIPQTYINTSGVATNVAANTATMSSSMIGDFTPHIRRVIQVPEVIPPMIPPYLIPIPV